MKRKSLWVIVLAAAAVAGIGTVANADIIWVHYSVRVLDASTSDPVQGATVHMEQVGGEHGGVAVTNERGLAQLYLGEGDYYISIDAPGYDDYTGVVEVLLKDPGTEQDLIPIGCTDCP